jgi:hypothetical protein
MDAETPSEEYNWEDGVAHIGDRHAMNRKVQYEHTI